MDKLRKISQNENNMVESLKNQTSILETTVNVIKATDSELNYRAQHSGGQIEERIESLTSLEEAMQLFFLLVIAQPLDEKVPPFVMSINVGCIQSPGSNGDQYNTIKITTSRKI